MCTRGRAGAARGRPRRSGPARAGPGIRAGAAPPIRARARGAGHPRGGGPADPGPRARGRASARGRPPREPRGGLKDGAPRFFARSFQEQNRRGRPLRLRRKPGAALPAFRGPAGRPPPGGAPAAAGSGPLPPFRAGRPRRAPRAGQSRAGGAGGMPPSFRRLSTSQPRPRQAVFHAQNPSHVTDHPPRLRRGSAQNLHLGRAGARPGLPGRAGPGLPGRAGSRRLGRGEPRSHE